MSKVVQEVEFKSNADALAEQLTGVVDAAKSLDSILDNLSEDLKFSEEIDDFGGIESILHKFWSELMKTDAKFEEFLKNLESKKLFDKSDDQDILRMQEGFDELSRSILRLKDDFGDYDFAKKYIENASIALEDYQNRIEAVNSRFERTSKIDYGAPLQDLKVMVETDKLLQEDLDAVVEARKKFLDDIIKYAREGSESIDIGDVGSDSFNESLEYFKNQIISIREQLKEFRASQVLDNSSLVKYSRIYDDLLHKFTELSNASENFKKAQGVAADTAVDSAEDMAKAYKKAYEELDNIQARKVSKTKPTSFSDWEGLEKILNKLNEDADKTEANLNEAVKIKDLSGLQKASNELDELSSKAEQVNRILGNLGDLSYEVSPYSDMLTGVESRIKGMRGTIDTTAKEASAAAKERLVSNISSGINTITSLVKNGISASYNFGKQSVSKYFGLLRNGFSSLFSYVKKQFSSISKLGSGAFGSFSSLFGQLKGLIGIASLGYLSKEMFKLSSTAVNMEGTLDNVFEESKDDIRDWSDEFAHRFSLTVGQARSFATKFGTSLGNLGISGSAQSEMAKNLTALSGDIASFYGKSLDESSNLLQQSINGNARAIKQIGIIMTDATLNEYAMARGYSETYSQMNKTNKAIVRYNYLLDQTTKMQGNASVSINSWTTQIRMLKSNLQALGSLMGGALIKLLYPVVTVLNTITASAVNAFNALAKLLGFQPIQLAENLGSAADIDDVSDALEDEADAYDDVSKSAKKAQDNIQGFDKLNVIQSETASSAVTKNAGSVGAGLLDFDSYYDSVSDVGDANQKLKEYLDELWKLLSEHDYYGAGKHIADGINYLVDEAYKALSDQKAYQAIDTFSDGITDFYSGLLNIDMVKAGQMLGAGFNLITYAINTLYEDAVSKDLLKQTGAKIADFFIGLDKEVDFKAAGQAFATGFRVMMDVARGFFDQAEANDLANKIGQDVKQFFLGAIDRAFGQEGAKEIGENIASLINFAFDFTIGLLGDGELASKLGDSIVTIINTSISNIDEGKLTAAASSLLNTIGILFNKLGDIDAEGLSDSIAGAINGVANNGSLSKAASGFSKAFLKIVEVIGDTITKVDWFKVGDAILDGIADAIKSNPKGGEYFAKALGIVFTATLASGALKIGCSALSKGIIDAIAKGVTASAPAAGTKIATTIGGSLAGAAGTASLVTAGIVLGGAFISGLNSTIRNKISEIGFENLIQGDNFTLLFDTSSLDEYVLQLTILQNTYANLDGSIEDARRYLEALRDAGMENTQAFIDLDNAINNYDNSGLLGRQAALDGVYQAAGNVQIQVSNCHNALAEMDQQSFDNLSANFGQLEVGATYTRDQLALIASETGQIGIDTGINYTSGVETGLQSKDLGAEASNQITNAGAAAAVQAPIAGVSAAVAYASGAANTLNSDTTVASSAQQNITSAGAQASVQAPIAGASAAIAYVSEAANTLNSDTTVASSAQQNIASAGAQATPEAAMQGEQIGTTTVEGISNVVESDTTTSAALKSNVSKATSEAGKDANKQGEGIGGHIISGIAGGLNKSEALNSLINSVKSICGKVVTTAKSVLKIHSPSRVFEEMFEYIPEGGALGIKNNAESVYKATEDMSKELIRKFDIDSIDISKVLDISSVSDVMTEARSKITESLSGINSKIGVSSDMLIQPRFKQTELQAITSQGATNSTIEQKLANLSSKVGLNKGSGQMQVSVYLDATNKLADFVIDTVNGQVVKGGMF